MQQLPFEWVVTFVVGLVTLIFGWLLPTPSKWFDGQKKQVEKIEERQATLERQHIESNAALRADIRVLAAQLAELTVTIKELTRRMDQNHGRPTRT